MQRIQILRTFTTIFWLGFFVAISFMEAPLKFTVPGVSMEEALALGRVMFSALNKCEWILFLILLATWFLNRPDWLVTGLILTAGVILISETFWLLPLLDIDAKRIIRGYEPAHNNLHVSYILLEMMKAAVLFMIGWKSCSRKLLFN